jgi:signal transduction histidine kinase
LIDTLMVIALGRAGADRGLLILPRGGELRVEVRLRQARVTLSELPESVLHYVIRTQESVLLDDASAPNQFSGDEYIRQTPARSVLCLPLVKQAKLIGVLYLENHLTSHVFTSARIAVLKLLASQAAISLENAHLYTELQQSEDHLRLAIDTIPMMVGIDPADVDRLFHAFFTTKPKGMGMGLSISRSIIDAHGGRLWACRNVGPGATFQFTLPLPSAH